MKEVGIRALKQNASAVVANAAAGEIVTITDRGRPVAQLTAIPRSELEQLIAAGAARSPKHDIRELELPEPGTSLSAELAAMRAAEQH